MNECIICKESAKYKDIQQIRRFDGTFAQIYYCQKHVKEGLNFGWLEEQDIREVK